MAIKHAKTSTVPDVGDTTLVQPSDWNANHSVDDNTLAAAKMAATAMDVVFGRSSAGAGAGEEIPLTPVARTLVAQTTQALMRSAGLGMNAGDTLAPVTGADAATAMVANSFYTVDGSILTASRVYTLPAAPAVGDRVGVLLTVGNASFELIIKGNASQTINGGAAASEWSRLFIVGETAVFRYVSANKWIVEYDGRIAQHGLLRLSASATGEGAGVYTPPTTKGGVWAADLDVGGITNASTGVIKTRRAAVMHGILAALSSASVSLGKYYGITATLNGTSSYIAVQQNIPGAGGSIGNVARSFRVSLVAGDNLTYIYFSEEGGRGLLALASPRVDTVFELREVF